MSSTIERSIDVDVPVRTAYDQWTQFETFPEFMEGVEQVRQLDDAHLAWKVKIAGRDVEWNAQIVRQEPDSLIAWRSISGARNDGTVRFEPLDGGRSRVHLRLDYEPSGVTEKVGDAVGLVAGRVEGDLRRFKEFIEARGVPEGAWRGEIP